MINHLLVPLDGSSLAECVLPHVIALAPMSNAKVSLLHVMQQPQHGGGVPAVDPIEWHLQKQSSEKYLDQVMMQMNSAGVLGVERVILEGNPANTVIEYAQSNNVDLIVLSTHGQSGLSGWNVSSVVQKILLRAYKSILLVRAYTPSVFADMTRVRYKRLFVGMDGSPRSEFVLPFAIGLARFHKAQLILETVIEKPQTVNRFPLAKEDEDWIDKFVEKNYQAASRYQEHLLAQFSLQDVELKAHVSIGDNAIAVLHDMADEANADLVLLAAHGHSGEKRWPYGSLTTGFIAYGNSSLLILQDLPEGEIHQTRAEIAARESRGH
ncbi:MAG TPA: universal stress protein [Anaerolineales bacterium]|nr:universal stress protein [Anaerolineales bacterium]